VKVSRSATSSIAYWISIRALPASEEGRSQRASGMVPASRKASHSFRATEAPRWRAARASRVPPELAGRQPSHGSCRKGRFA
jgi:hypothetical protein